MEAFRYALTAFRNALTPFREALTASGPSNILPYHGLSVSPGRELWHYLINRKSFGKVHVLHRLPEAGQVPRIRMQDSRLSLRESSVEKEATFAEKLCRVEFQE